MIQHADLRNRTEVRTPLWRRVTALFSLGSIVVMTGIGLAVVIGATALLMLFVLERAIAG